MYKQLEKLITLTNNDLNLVNRRFGQRTDITSEKLELLRILFNYDRLSQYDVNSGLKMLFYGGLKMSFFSGLRLSYI
ncbi:Putative ATL autolysin transcription regulator [Staphylococcus aureus]|nr:Putative ATL autolysin transcription regulator [Staphylococcus aureus]